MCLKKEMEFCMEAKALKSSLLSKTSVKTTDDMWCLTGINSVDDSDSFSVDDSDSFSVDDLLDFSEVSFLEEKNSLTFSSHDKTIVDDENSNFTSPGSGDFGSLPAGEPPFPVDEVEFLEWLSQFVYDSFSFSGLTGNSTFTFDVNRSEPAAKKFTVLDLPKPVPKKARSKWPRRRPNGNIWSLSLIILTNSLSSSFYSSPNSQGSSIPSPVMNSNPVEIMDTFDPPVLKKQKKGWFCEEPGSVSSGSNCVRKCSHCLVEKTPQWRTGPLGPKTLCNACGVRFKLGRLFPEYRPACSPTFAGDIHSNSHRKVLEMRRKKGAVEHEMSGFMPMVRSIEV